MKDYLKKLIARKKNELKAKEEKMKNSQDIEEVRSLGETLIALRDEINDAEEQLAKLEDDDNNKDDNKDADKDNNTDDNNDDANANEGRSANGFNPNATLNVLGQARMNNRGQEFDIDSNDPRATMEYRKAFMNYIQRGEINRDVLLFESRADATGTSSELGVLIPTTVIQKIITDVEKVYGQLYSRVLKTNLQGGVKYPIGSFSATFKRITETTVSDRQNAGGVTGSVEFSYKIGEIRMARTLLQTILSVPVFEEEFAKVIVKAYVQAMDKEIMNGQDANNECVGILTEAKKSSGSRIPAANIITFTAAEMADWKAWQEKLFAKIPLAMRGLNPEFAMTANTYEANIKTLTDDNNRPVYNETFNPVDGSEISKFKGKNVAFVEEDVLKNFNDAADGDYFGMYWVPEEAYAINSNMEFTVVDYFDHEKNQYIKKALVINDGKILDPKYIYLLKKSVTA
jgi:HK97 family phage major capsid protein